MEEKLVLKSCGKVIFKKQFQDVSTKTEYSGGEFSKSDAGGVELLRMLMVKE